MLEICNHTRSTLPSGLQSRLDFTLGVALESALDSSLDCAFGSVSALDCSCGICGGDKNDKKLCEKVHIELVFVGSTKMRKINKEFLAKDYATDVLSFPLIDSFMDSPHKKDLSLDSSDLLPLLLGSIVINLPLARKNSLKFSHSLEEEIMILFIHAILHLLGFDHERDRGEHRQKEREIMQKLGLSKSLKSLISRASSPQ